MQPDGPAHHERGHQVSFDLLDDENRRQHDQGVPEAAAPRTRSALIAPPSALGAASLTYPTTASRSRSTCSTSRVRGPVVSHVRRSSMPP